ncbi:DUF1211 domain-containing protein [Sphingomonas sp. XMGL2]|uniref:DUF1211 domain-containing protein n=1 Tax=Sphingomonas quercus TaxID=2842451 RepID=A0ABS6BN16_9SPHN|nr:DUF1211 domain-containing protein [Sphingomonas quercus]
MIAVVITIMVLELKPPVNAELKALLPLWPIAISYAVSYLFIAIIWMNHHHLLRFVRQASPPLLWLNFAHLFAVSLLPFATSWMADSHLAATPVAVYAGLFVVVNLIFLAFEREVIRQADPSRFPPRAQRLAGRRSVTTVAIFVAATALAALAPGASFALICAALLLYLRPEAPGSMLTFFKQ